MADRDFVEEPRDRVYQLSRKVALAVFVIWSAAGIHSAYLPVRRHPPRSAASDSASYWLAWRRYYKHYLASVRLHGQIYLSDASTHLQNYIAIQRH